MNNYEAMFIIDPKLSEEDTNKAVGVIQEEVKKNGGENTSVEVLGKRRLAFKVKKNLEGYYFLMKFSGPGGMISKMLAKYRINESILRQLIIKQ